MDVLLFCCIGNVFQSPLLAALYNAEAEALGESGRAISAGLSNRTEMPPTAAYLLEAVKRGVPELPKVFEALSAHRPTPLKTLPFVEVRGVSYLYDPARKAEHLVQDARAIHAWLTPAPTTSVLRLAMKDAGYEAWDQAGRPALESEAGQEVLLTYIRQVGELRSLARSLLGVAAPLDASLVAPLEPPKPPRVIEPVVSTVKRPAAAIAAPVVPAYVKPTYVTPRHGVPVPSYVTPSHGTTRLPATAYVTPSHGTPRPVISAYVTPSHGTPRPPVSTYVTPAQGTPRFGVPLPTPSSGTSRDGISGLSDVGAVDPSLPRPARRIVQIRPEPVAPSPASEAASPSSPKAKAPRTKAPKTRDAEGTAAKPAQAIASKNAEARPPEATEARPAEARTPEPRAPEAPAAEASAPEASAEGRPTKPTKSKKAASPQETERAEVLEDVRAWLRAALPVRRTSLTRYGLWQRAEKAFGSWDEALVAADIPVAKEPLWMLPRDSELSLDILIEALPDPIVARLSSLSVAKVRGRRRANGAPDAARQLVRRIMATDRLGKVADEVIAKELGISTEDVASVRESEGIASPG